MWAWIKQEYWYIHGTFHNSENILWARLNAALGVLWVALQGVDISQMQIFHEHPEYLVYYIIFSNVMNEYTRRRNAEYNPDGSLK